MPLALLAQREPFARVSGNAEIVRGPAFWRFRASLEKYCRGRSLGRSIVISGNRGVGKTTMVLAAIEDLRRQSELEQGEAPRADDQRVTLGTSAPLRRPLLVSLNGPDIVRERVRPRYATSHSPTRPPSQLEKNGNGSGPVSATRVGPEAAGAGGVPLPALANPGTAEATPSSNQADLVSRIEDSDNLLRQITRALHTAVSREFAQRYEETLPRWRSPEWLEAGAQLTLELNSGAKVAALRRFWDLSERLWKGVLFKPPALPSSVEQRIKWDRQGLYELVALDVLADAYRIAIGTVTEDSSLSSTDSLGDQQISWADELKNVVAPLAGLLGGAATGLGVFNWLPASTFTKALGSVGAALLSALVLTFSFSAKRTGSTQSTSKFSRDNGVGSLAWRLGGVVDLLFQAGIAPVFVIDELDKVTLAQDLGEWIGDRAQELKSLLTERAFFCFLTGRGFAEKLHRERTERSYPPSYTQFSNYLFVNYLPVDLHRYLRRILAQRPASDATAQQHDDMEAAILPHVVLFRAEMHPIDIQRELNALVIENDDIELYPKGKSVPRADSFALLFQIAVEAVVSDEKIERRMRDDPRFALLAVDAVYYAPRMWRRGTVLDVSADAINRYLARRRTPDDESDGNFADCERAVAENGASTADDVVAPAAPEVTVSQSATDGGTDSGHSELQKLPASDEMLLRGCVLDLVARIRNTQTLRDVILSSAFEERLRLMGEKEPQRQRGLILDALPKTEALLEPIGDSTTRFRWQYDLHGFAIASDSSIERVRESVAAFRVFQREVDAPLRQQTGFGLEYVESRLSLMQFSMKWQEAVQHADRLDAATGIGDAATAMVGEAAALEEYTTVASAAAPRIARGIALSKLLAPRKALREGLAAVADALELSLLPNDERGSRISGALADLEKLLAVQLETADSVRGFSESLSKLLAQASRFAPPELALWNKTYLDNWRARLIDRIAGTAAQHAPSWADVAMALSRDGKPTQLNTAWLTKSAYAWTDIALSALAQQAASDGIVYPQWAAPYAFALLGVPALAIATMSDVPELGSFLHERLDWYDRRFVVIVSAQPSALAISSWSVSEPIAALVVSRERFAQLATCLAPLMKALSARGAWLIVESTENEGPIPPEALLDSSLAPAWLAFWEPSRRLQVFQREPPKRSVLGAAAAAAIQAFRSTPRFIVDARGIDDAVAKADHVESTASATT